MAGLRCSRGMPVVSRLSSSATRPFAVLQLSAFTLRLKKELPSWAKMRMVDPKEPLESQVLHH